MDSKCDKSFETLKEKLIMLSLKFRPHRATRTPHRQHRKTVIHGTRINSTAQQKGQNYTKMAKKLKGALHPLRTRARAQHLRTLGA
jgi:ribosomal protein L20